MAKDKSNIGAGELEFNPTFIDKLMGKKTSKDGLTVITTIQERWESAKNSMNSGYRNKGLMKEFLFPSVKLYSNKNAERKGIKDKYIDLSYVMIETIHSLAFDVPIDVQISANKPDNELDAQVYQAIVKHILTKNNEAELRRKLQKNSLVNGTGVFKISVCKKRNGKAYIKIDNVDPTTIAVDPIAQNQNEIKWTIEVATYSKNYLKNKYPKYDLQDDGVLPDSNEVLMDNNNSEQDGAFQGVNVYEQYEVDDTDPEGKTVKYTVATDTQILETKKMRLSMGIPYVFAPAIDVANSIFGVGIYEKIKPANDDLNILLNNIHLMAERCAKPTLLVNMSSGINPKTITNQAGEVIPVLKAQDLTQSMRWEYGPQINPEFSSLVKSNEYWIQTLAGVNDVSLGRGEVNSGMPSGKSLEEMSTNAQTRVRQFVRNLKECYRVLGIKLCEIINDVMDEEEIIKITGGDVEAIMKVFEKEKIDTIVKLKGAAVTPEDYAMGLKIANEEKGIFLKKSDDGSAYFGFVGDRLEEPTDMDINVKSGLDIKWNKTDMAQQAVQLFSGNKIDFETYLTMIDMPDNMKRMLLEKEAQKKQEMQQQQQQMMQMQMAQQQGQQAQAPMPPDQPLKGKVEAPAVETGSVKGGENIQ